jgi:hypothetical protein
MRIRVKKSIPYGVSKIESSSNIDDIVVEENLLSPEKETISIFFRGNDSSGILNLTTKEFESLMNSVKPNINLVKTMNSQPKRFKSKKKKLSKSKKSRKRK